jgi:hypothetical protein
MNKLEKLIKEDLVNYTAGGGQGYDWHNRSQPMQMSLIDILKADRGDYEKARRVIPHQIQTTFERLLTLSDQVDQLKSDMIRAYSNPMIKEDDKKREIIKSMVKDLSAANDKYMEVVKKLDQLQF